MAIFQPSNIIPSNFAGIGGQTIDATSNISVSWQVNGNSPMTAFQLQFYNNKTSVLVKDTGKISLDTPFYGTDNKGNRKQFVYEPTDAVWLTEWGLSNGNEYKMVITQFWVENKIEQSVTQWSGSVFFTRATPNVTVSFIPVLSNGKGTVAKQGFTANVTYANSTQEIVLNSVRWQFGRIDSDITGLNNPVDESLVTIIDDTGSINTNVLAYEYSGLFTGKIYAINCTVQTQEGVEKSSGWQAFEVSYTQAEISDSNTLSVQCLADDSVLLSWADAVDIQGVMSPEGTTPVVKNEMLELSEGQTVTWNKVGAGAMNFGSPWTAGIRVNTPNRILPQGSTIRKNRTQCDFAISPDKKIVVTSSYVDMDIYDYKGHGNLTFRESLYNATGIGEPNATQYYAFSPDGKYLVYSRGYTPTAKDVYGLYLYKISADGSFSSAPIKISSISSNGGGREVVFSPTANYFIVGGYFVYKIADNGTATLLGVLYKHNLNRPTQSFFSNDGKYFYIHNEGTIIKYPVNWDIAINDWNFEDTGVSAVNAVFTANNIVAVYSYGSRDGYLSLFSYNSNTGSLTQIGERFALRGENQKRTTFTVSPDGNTLFCSRRDEQYSPARFIVASLTDNNITITQNSPMPSWEKEIYATLFIDNDAGLFYGYNQGIFEIVTPFAGLQINDTDYLYDLPLYSWLNLVTLNQTASISDNGEIRVNNYFATRNAIGSISSLKLIGKTTVDWLYVGNDYNAIDSQFTPQWNENTLFFADFLNDEDALQGGTSSAGGVRTNALYRVLPTSDTLEEVYEIPTKYNKIKDYGIRSGQEYSWEMFYFAGDSTYSKGIESGKMCRQFKSYTLLEGKQDDDFPNVYHIVKVWKFGNNLSVGSISNNNTPNWLTNFTPYRLRQPSSRLGQSGTLQALLSNYNQNENFYEDTIKISEELKKASISNNTFFLKDMKGNLLMVGISGPITQTINIKSKVQEITISVPWEEVGDAHDVSLIQLPDDEGWEQDDAMSVVLTVNPKTGILSAIYPEDYYGTEFSLYALTPVEVNGQILFKLENGSVKATKKK
nr:MAG TPA: Lactonase, 7-bladed beta-propeller [Caudoviricetes sp.]